MKPEEKAEVILWDWLKTKSLNIEKVYFNRMNKLDQPIFKVKGICRRIPDIVFSLRTGNGIEFIAVEVKDAQKSINVQDSQKILDYYKNYYLKKTKYFLNDEEIEISSFVVATNNSPKGYLFEEEPKFGFQDNKEDHENLLKYNLFPRYEFVRTHDFLRGLISRFKDLRKELGIVNEASSLGILISTPKIDSLPHQQIIKYIDKSFWDKKSQWGQRFQRL